MMTHEEELSSLAAQLFDEGARMMRLRPNVQVSDAVRGLPAVLTALCEVEVPLTAGDLARLTGLTSARIANILKALEAKGFIERRTAADDRRRVEVMATPLGREEEASRRKMGERFVMEFLDELGLEDARDLVRVLRRVNEVMVDRRAEGRDELARAMREGRCER